MAVEPSLGLWNFNPDMCVFSRHFGVQRALCCESRKHPACRWGNEYARPCLPICLQAHDISQHKWLCMYVFLECYFLVCYSQNSQSNQSRTSIVFLPPFASSGALNSLLYVFYNFCVLWWYSQPFKISTKTLIDYSWAGISKIVFIITWVTGLQTTISSLVLIQHSAK